jgi:hypothetical protein
LSEFLYTEVVETFCSKKRCQVLISLRALGMPKGNVISGVPESCNCDAGCSKGALCLLKAKKMSTGRKRR